MKKILAINIFLFFLISCNEKKENTTPNTPGPSEAFKERWFAGKAELTSYSLEQARYGEIRKGEAVLIFVTEDFSKTKLVKLDEPEKTTNKTKVLKLNMTKSFQTGIYPYSMMLSVFTPVDESGNAKTLKANASVQEWCGQTFSSLQLNSNKYNWTLYSYFEKEGEQDKQLNSALLEDELWNRIRINPTNLPQGKMKILPGLFWQRFSHNEMIEQEAELTLKKLDTAFQNEKDLQVYAIHYPETNRTLQIYFRSVTPYEIVGWQETYADGFGENKKLLTTRAIKKQTIWLDYWKHNKNIDSTYLDSLQLKRYGN